jgi:hypothetical protein
MINTQFSTVRLIKQYIISKVLTYLLTFRQVTRALGRQAKKNKEFDIIYKFIFFNSIKNYAEIFIKTAQLFIFFYEKII